MFYAFNILVTAVKEICHACVNRPCGVSCSRILLTSVHSYFAVLQRFSSRFLEPSVRAFLARSFEFISVASEILVILLEICRFISLG